MKRGTLTIVLAGPLAMFTFLLFCVPYPHRPTK